MDSRVWQLEHSRARLTLSALSATLDTSEPESGLRSVTLKHIGQLLIDLDVLGVDLPPAPSQDSSRRECYVREGDLVATYYDSPAPRFRAQIYWRAGEHAFPGTHLAIELVASLQTDLLESNPELASVSRCAPREILLIDAHSSSPARSISLDSATHEFERGASSGCFLFRLADGLTYVEMAHPDNFYRSRLTISPPAAGQQPRAILSHALLAHRLEKGVILRSRVLGLLVDTEKDLEDAAKHYRAFSETPLPLTT